MKIEGILYLTGVILSLTFLLLNVWRAYVHYSEDKPLNWEPVVFLVYTLALTIKIPYLLDKPLAVMFYTTSSVLSLVASILYSL